MTVQLVELIFNDTPSGHNRDLTEYLKRNLSSVITKGGIKFKFIIAKANDLQQIRRRGIKRLPALLPQKGRPVIGVPDIIQFLGRSVRNSKTIAKPKTEEEVLDSYFRKTIGDIKVDDDKKIIPFDDQEEDMTEGGGDLLAKYNEFMNRREGKEPAKRASRVAPPKPSWNHEQDDDYTERAQMPSVHNAPTTERPRADNVYNEPGDPLAALNRISNAGGASADDDMMRALLERTGGADANF